MTNYPEAGLCYIAKDTLLYGWNNVCLITTKTYLKTGASLGGRIETELTAHWLQHYNFTSGKIGNSEKQNGDRVRDKGGVNSESPLFTHTR